MFRSFSSLFLLLCSFITLCSCSHFARVRTADEWVLPNQQSVSYNLPLPSNLTAIEANEGIEVRYTFGNQPSLKVTTNLSDTTLLNIYNSGGTLIFSYQISKNQLANVHTIIEIVGPRAIRSFEASSAASIIFTQEQLSLDVLDELEANSAGRIEVKQLTLGSPLQINCNSAGHIEIEKLSAPNLHLECSSSAKITVKEAQIANLIEAEASSAATISIQGKAQSAHYEASSGSTIEASKLQAQQGRATASSGAEIQSNNLKHLGEETSGGEVINHTPSTQQK